MYAPIPRPRPLYVALALAVVSLSLALPFAPLPLPALPAAPAQPPATIPVGLDDLPVLFTPNQGQADPRAAFYVRGRDKTLFFRPDGVTFLLATAEQRWSVALDFVGTPGVAPRGEAPSGATLSYFRGPEEDWQTGLATYERLVYPELWPGVDLVYAGTLDRIKYEFVVHPGADPAWVRLAYRGAQSVALTPDGRIAVTTPAGSFEDAAPIAFQEIGGQRVPVEARYALDAPAADGSVGYGFALGAYDPTLPLIIDPEVIVYAGYIGGSDLDSALAVAVDPQGNVVIAGNTASSSGSFPVLVGPDTFYNDVNDGRGGSRGDVFVAKLRPDGSGLVFVGYIGGSRYEMLGGMALDSQGNILVGGTTSSDERSFPVTVGPDLTFASTDEISSAPDAFVAKVRSDGTDLIYCGYIGGQGSDEIRGVAVGPDGSLYVAGQTTSNESSFPVAVGPDLTYTANDGFVARVQPDGTGLLFAGYLGGPDLDVAEAIAVDASGAAYVVGETTGAIPTVVGPDLTPNGGFDGFIAKVAPTGASLVYAGYIGGANRDSAMGIAAGRRRVRCWSARSCPTR